jgi:anion-transporting  ArsA/GET3 family ATPase
MHLGRVLRGVFVHPLYRAFVDAAPGLKDLMVTGKIRAELLIEREGFRSRWDWIVVDAGASGHAIELLRTPLVMADTFGAGRVRRESGGIRDLYSDARRTTIHVVATPEEMPVAEAIATVSKLRSLGLPLGTAFVNRCRPPAPPGTEEALTRLEAEGDDGVAAVVTAARRELGWVRLQERDVRRLSEETGLKLLELPNIPSGLGGAGKLGGFADLVGEAIQ